MTKKRAKKIFTLTSILMIFMAILTFVSFTIPFTINGVSYDYVSFIDNISLGLDLKGGITAVYTATLPEEDSSTDFSDAMESTIEGLLSILTGQGYTEATVVQQGTNSIRVEVPDVDDPEEVLEMIGEPAVLYFRTSDDTSEDPFLSGKDIDDVYASYDSSSYSWGVTVEFDNAASIVFSEVTTELASSGGSIYMYLGDTYFSQATVDSTISGGTTFISGGSITDQASAEEYALNIKSGTFSLNLTMQSSSIVSPTLGDNALTTGVIAGAIGLILIFIFMFLVYGHFGLLANVSLFIYTMLLVFFLQAVPGIQLTLPGIAGIILSIGMAVDANIIIFERIKDEYKEGKTFSGSVKLGYKKSITSILDANITTIIASICLAIFGTSSVQGFALTLLIGLVLSVFASLVITRWLLKLYLPFNYNKAEKVKMYRDEEAKLYEN